MDPSAFRTILGPPPPPPPRSSRDPTRQRQRVRAPLRSPPWGRPHPGRPLPLEPGLPDLVRRHHSSGGNDGDPRSSGGGHRRRDRHLVSQSQQRHGGSMAPSKPVCMFNPSPSGWLPPPPSSIPLTAAVAASRYSSSPPHTARSSSTPQMVFPAAPPLPQSSDLATLSPLAAINLGLVTLFCVDLFVQVWICVDCAELNCAEVGCSLCRMPGMCILHTSTPP